MTGLDVSHLSPGDAVVALRSYPRRYAAVLSPLADDPDTVDGLARQVGPDGVSALDLLTDTVRSLGIIGQAFDEVGRSDEPVLAADVTDPSARYWGHVPFGGIAEALAELASAATTFADRAERTKGSGWSRSGAITGRATSVSAAGLLREAVRTAADNLRGIEARMDALRRG